MFLEENHVIRFHYICVFSNTSPTCHG